MDDTELVSPCFDDDEEEIAAKDDDADEIASGLAFDVATDFSAGFSTLSIFSIFPSAALSVIRSFINFSSFIQQG